MLLSEKQQNHVHSCEEALVSQFGGATALQVCASDGQDEELNGLCKEGKLDKALDVVMSMDQRGAVPSVQMFRSLLKICGERKALGQARRVHGHLVKHGLEFTSILGEYLVITLVKCNGFVDALRVFDRLPVRTVFSWTAVISGYVTAGQVQTALMMYDRMRQEGVQPNRFTIVNVLKGCACTSNLREGMRIHSDALRYRCDSDLYVATGLVHMYAKCGNIAEAQRIFDGLSRRDVVLWNAMLAGYVSQAQAEKVLQAYECMQKEYTIPDGWTFVSALQACGILADEEEDADVDGRQVKVKALQKSKAIHFVACRRGYGSDEFVGNTLVSVYSKCGSIADAENVFDALSQRNVVAWTAMIALCTQKGLIASSLELYKEMQDEGVSPNDRTFVNLLQACGMVAETEEDVISLDGQLVKLPPLGMGKEVHAALWAKGYESDPFVANTLISMYGKFGSISDAQTVFDNLANRDVVSWTAMLMAHNQQTHVEMALLRYEEMLEEGVSPNDRTYVSMLQTCGMLADKEEEEAFVNGQHLKAESLRKGKALHADARMRGYAADVFVGNTLISFYGKCGSIADAECMFEQLSERDVVSWNAILTSLVQHAEGEQCLFLYRQMHEEGVTPNDRTLVVILQTCGLLAEKEEDIFVEGGCWVKPKALELGKAVHADACRMGYGSDVFIGNTLVSVYGKCGSIVDAANVFDGLLKKTVVSWNAMIAAHVEQGDGERALELYREMLKEGAICNDVTIVCILQACCKKGSLDICRHVHQQYISSGNALNLLVANTLIHTYGRSGSMEEAQQVFDSLPRPNAVSWTALMAGYARQGNCTASLQCYERMQLVGTRPNAVTFLCLLSACNHAGLVDEGILYFESMTRVYGIAPNIDHYGSMVDLLARAGYFEMVEELISTMSVQPDLSMWLCLLGACRKHAGKVGLAKQAFERAVALLPNHASAYVLMSSIYSQAGLWDLALEVNGLRQKAGAWKKAGQSWTGVAQELHCFVVGDKDYPQSVPIHDLLSRIGVELEKEGLFVEKDRLLGVCAVSSRRC